MECENFLCGFDDATNLTREEETEVFRHSALHL